MRKNLFPLQTLLALAIILFVSRAASAAVVIWNGVNGGADTNWSTAGNWTGTGLAPTSSDDTRFADVANPGTAVSNINNIVDTSFTIKSLMYATVNVNGNDTTLINPGQTLTINGGLITGTETDLNDATRAIFATVTGPGGTLTINNTSSNLVVRQGSTITAAGSMRATLDLSGLDNFNATVSQVRLGASGLFSRPAGVLYLARTNVITASGSAPSIQLGGDGASPGNAGNASFMYLGLSNVIYANSMTTSRTKQGGCSVLFNPVYATNGSNPTLLLRGAAGGTSRMSALIISDSGTGTGTVAPTGTNDFSGGILDAMVDTVTVAKTSSSTSSTAIGNPSATLSFSGGTFDINTLQIGFQGGTAVPTNFAVGTVNAKGGTMLVNTLLEMGHIAAGTNGNRGTLNIRDSIVDANTIICGLGTNTITLTNGTLNVTNTLGTSVAGVGFISTTNSTFGLAAQLGLATSAYVTNLTTGGITNVINILSIPTLSAYPSQFPLIKYTGTIGGAGYNFGLGTLPATSPAFVGYISNNVAAGSIDLVLTFGPAPARSLIWTGLPSGDWDILGNNNWQTNGVPTSFNGSDFVTFDDTASGATTVNLTIGLAPSSLTVNNTNKNYTFVGDHITGPTGLNKQGPGTLILNTGGNNNFTGAINIGGGTLQIGNADNSGNLPATTPITDNGTLTYSVTADITVSNVISGTGGVTHNGNNARLTLGGANTFAGVVSVATDSLLIPANNSALGTTNSGTVIASGGELDLSGITTANGLNLGAESITVSGSGLGALGSPGAIVNNGSVAQQNALRFVTLAGNTTIGGSSRWDIRATPTSNPTTAGLSTSPAGSAYNLTKIGGAQISLVGVTVEPALGDIDIQGGTLSMETVTTSLGDPSKTITVESGATFQMFSATNQLNKKFTLMDGSFITNASGNNTIIGPMVLNGGVTVVAGGTSLTLSNSITGTGSLTKEGTNTVNLSGTASPGGGTTVNRGILAVNGTLSGALSVGASGTLSGTGTVSGLADVSGTVNPGAVSGAGTLTASGGLTLEGGAILAADLNTTNTASGGVNDLLTVGGAFTANGNQVRINLLQPQARMQTGSYRLVNYSGGSPGGFGSIITAQPSRYSFTLDTATLHQVNVVVGGNPFNLKWNTTTDTNWDVNTTLNWLDPVGATNTQFFAGDSVLFDDTASVTTSIFIPTNVVVLPSSITNNSSANNFTISGVGKISGTASIVKQGGSTLTLATSNDFTGTVTVLGGVLKLGGAGVTNVLGLTNGGTIIASGAALDVANNTNNIGLEPLTISGSGISGAGAIINSSSSSTFVGPNFAIVTLAGDTTIGGPGRLDLRSNPSTTNFASLSTGGNPYKLTKISASQFQVTGAQLDPALGDIEVQGGIFGVQGFTTLGNSSSNLIIFNAATLQFFNVSNVMSKVLVLRDGSTVNNNSGVNTYGGPVTLQGTNTFSVGGTSVNFTNVISGTGALLKTGTNNLILTAANTYTGNTLVSTGTVTLSGTLGAVSASPTIIVSSGATLDASVRADSTLALANNQTLYGNGTVKGTLQVGSGATVAPGAGTNTVGALTVAGAVTLSGTTFMDIDQVNNTNDQLRSTSATLTYGGTLALTTNGNFAVGNSFTLFTAANFAPASAFTTIIPASPGAGLAWDTSFLTTTGALKVKNAVVSQPHISALTVTGTSLSITGTGGPVSGNYRVLTSTVIDAALNTWAQVGTGSFDGSGNFSFGGSINPAEGHRYYVIQTQ